MLFQTLLLALPMLAAASSDPGFFPQKNAENVNPDTHLVLTFNEVPTLGEKGLICVFDAMDGSLVDKLDISIPAGPTQGRQYGPECDYMKAPYDYARTSVPTNRDTRPGTPSCGATATYDDGNYQLTIIGGFTDGFHFHPVLIRDNTAIIYLHNNILERGHEYYVTIDNGTIKCGNFKGVQKNEWKFKTKSDGPDDPHNIMVNCNGTADFNTVQGALDYIPDWSDEKTVVNIAKGEYEEIVYFRNKSNVVIRGEGMDKTIVHYANSEVFNPHPLNYKTNEKKGTFPSRRAAFTIDNCRDITIEDIYIATDLWGQAEGILVNGERIAIYRSKLVGTGDAWQLNGTVYLEGCTMDGAGDAMLGRGSVFAYRCHFLNAGGPMSWVRNFAPDHGDVLVECLLETKSENGTFDYGRTNTQSYTGYPDAEFVVIDCRVRNLNPKGWSHIGMPSQTMLEFNTRDADTGMPVDVSQRDPLSRQLDAVRDAETIRNYRNPAYVLKGWNPRVDNRSSLSLAAQMPRGGFGTPVDYASEEGRRIGDNLLLYQRITGGWPKNTNMNGILTPMQTAQILKDKQRTDDSTVDNNATTSQMATLARVYRATGDTKYRDGFVKGLEYLLAGQYENGGWPQFWPNPRDYQVNITFNDNNIANILTLFRNVCESVAPYDCDIVTDEMKIRLQASYEKGIECILNAQIVVKKHPTVWCQQVDPVTLAPITGRAFELPSYCSTESARLVQFLMGIRNPDKRVKAAIHGAMKWFDSYKITGYKVERTAINGERTTRLVEDSNAQPLWGRFYDLEYCEPFVCDRDGLAKRRLEQIGRERRNGYNWFNSNPLSLYDEYFEWVKKNDPKYKVKVSKESKGGNELGTFTMFRKHEMDPKYFDVVVNPGESIQTAIDKAPATANGYFKILVKSGIYHEAINIDKPAILLVGENRANTVIELSEKDFPEIQQDGKGGAANIVNITEAGVDFIMSGFTLTNGFDASPTDPKQPQSIRHRMVVMGRADRTIIINTTINSNGNDALSLWAPGGNGMYYHSDLDINTPGVDFVCPRGWCYMTRCNFYGDSRAMIWHDGRGSKDKKLVITNSNFDAASPTLLGRYHHDAHIYILHSRMSANILDQNIHYAYSDQVKDPCVWGERFYYYNNVREGGHSGWLTNNLDRAPIGAANHFLRGEKTKPLEHYECTALWTFDGRWNPEKTLRDLWEIIEY